MHKVNKKILAVFLLAAFAQKLSVGLYLHNWFHKNKKHVISSYNCQAVDKGQAKCNCIDDVLMPLIASTSIDEVKTPQLFFSPLLNHYRFFLISAVKTFHEQRGPPILPL
ncbi:MAG TPA: hypothetical protein VMT76_07585 [Puia sp.]|nr:hypothetical protein [Puia sp.]